MKKLVVSLAVLGLVAGPASAHRAEGVKCRARIVKVEQVAPEDSYSEYGHQMVKTRVRITNTSDKTLKRPKLTAGIYDLNGPLASDDERIGDDEFLPKNLEPGETRVQTSFVNVDAKVFVDVEDIRIDSCHRSWHTFD